ISEFLKSAAKMVQNESDTIQWFAVKGETGGVEAVAIFDTFHTEAGREAHLAGKVATGLIESAPLLFSKGPEIGKVSILASKVKQTGHQGLTGGLSIGLQVIIQAKEEKVSSVREFL
ncbi:hypothetical protein AMATHDRAFT_104723, partial [Amanita thiersii Skay4041]